MATFSYIGSFGKFWDEEGIAKTLETLGHEVIRIPETPWVWQDFKDALKGDYLLFAKLKVPYDDRPKLVKLAKDRGMRTICWIPDLYWGLSREWRITAHDAIFSADVVCTPDGGHDAAWSQLEVNHRLLRQGIPDKYCFMDKPVEKYQHDIVFVGQLNPEYPYRTQLIRKLRERYEGRFHWYGREDSDEIRGDELNKLYASAKVVIGESVYSPYYWSNRIYETLGRGGFLIHPIVEGLEKEYTPYKHFIPYKHGDFPSLFEAIDHYLEDGTRRDVIRSAAFEHTKNNHTLTHRCKQLMEYLTTTP